MAECPEIGGYPFHRLAGPRPQYHSGAGSGQCTGARSADASAGTGHHSRFARQRNHAEAIGRPSSASTASSRMAPRVSTVASPSSGVAAAGAPKYA